MSHWYSPFQAPEQAPIAYLQTPVTPIATTQPIRRRRTKDSNTPEYKFQVNQKCIYERRLPGDAYISAHVARIQPGYYDSPSITEDRIDHVRFIAINFVFHPSRTANRFTSATISVGLHDDTDQRYSAPAAHAGMQKQIGEQKPKFLRWAPHLLYGSISPETLNWTFNLAGSFGVSQTPVSASLKPSAALKASYKLYEMMRIQGSVRTLSHWFDQEYAVEDGEIVWTLEENRLQKSGLPREFSFVMLMTKGDIENVVFDLEIEPVVSSWFGHFPSLWMNTLKHRPLHREPVDLDMEIGQKFEPSTPGRGFNFANLATTFDDFVSLPGTTFSTSEPAAPRSRSSSTERHGHHRRRRSRSSSRTHRRPSSYHPDALNLRVFLDNQREQSSPYSPIPASSEKRKSRTIDILGPPRRQSQRHSISRSDLQD